MALYGKTVAVDLDGVLAEYNGFQGADVIEGPTKWARRLLKQLNKKYKVIVFTCRNTERARDWLAEHGLLDLVAGINYCQINGRMGKPVAVAYIDDRAVRWDGDLEAALQEVDLLAETNYAKDVPKTRKLTSEKKRAGKERRGITGTDLIAAIERSHRQGLEPVFEAAMAGNQVILKAAEDPEFEAISHAIWDRGVPL